MDVLATCAVLELNVDAPTPPRLVAGRAKFAPNDGATAHRQLMDLIEDVQGLRATLI